MYPHKAAGNADYQKMRYFSEDHTSFETVDVRSGIVKRGDIVQAIL
jgi:hypothetical protein